jgi:hypothetical protein
VLSILLSVYEIACEFLLAFKGGKISFGLVAVAESDLVELEHLCLAFAFNLDDPCGVCHIPDDAFYAGVEVDVLEEVKMLGVVLHELLEMVWIHMYWII